MSIPAVTPQPTDNSVAMYDEQRGETRMIPPDQVESAKGAGLVTSVKMLGKEGDSRWIPPSQVAAARQSNYSVAPDDPGAQLMITPGGQKTYALPNEVDNFKKSGHTLIHPDGQFRVEALPGEDQTETYQRARNVVNALTPEEQQKAMAAEKDWWTSKEGLKDEAAGLANVGLTTAETLATITGVSEAASLGKAGLRVLGETVTMQLIKSSPRLYAEWLLKHHAV